MTIEIRQLILRAVVEEPATAGDRLPGRRDGPARTERRPDRAPLAPGRDPLVAACVREVLRRIERERER